jgi:hypothetical protein
LRYFGQPARDDNAGVNPAAAMASADAFVRALAQRLQGQGGRLWDDLREAPPDPEALLRAAEDVLDGTADEATERTTDKYDYAAQLDGDRLRI